MRMDFFDLAIGVPGKNFGAMNSSGIVVVMYGSTSGLTALGSQAWGQNLPPEINGRAEDYDEFGSSLGVIKSPLSQVMLPVISR